MRKTLLALAVCLAACYALATAAPRQETSDYYYSLEYFRSQGVADLKILLEAYKEGLPLAERNAKLGESSAVNLLRHTKSTLDNIRVALGENGVPVRATWEQAGEASAAVAAGGAEGGAAGAGGAAGGRAGGTTLVNVAAPKGNTQVLPKPSREKPPGPGAIYALPAIILLRTVQIGDCTSRGKSLTDCAWEVVAPMAAGAAGGLLITIAVPAATTGLTVVSTFVTAGSTVINVGHLGSEVLGAARAIVGEAYADARRADALAANTKGMTPERMAATVAAFRRDLTEVDKQNAASERLYADLQIESDVLDEVVQSVRTRVTMLGDLNAAIALAASKCGDPEKNPVRFMVDADERAKHVSGLAERIVDGSSRARALAESCPTAEEARHLFSQAGRDASDANRIRLNAAEDLRDAAVFFPIVKGARAASISADRVMLELDQRVAEARRAGARLQDVAARYRTTRRGAQQIQARLFTTAKALRGAFPNPPPAHIAAGLLEIDKLQPAAVMAVDDDALRRYAEAAASDVNRVEGLVREAKASRKSLKSCENIADEIPEALKNQGLRIAADLTRNSTAISNALEAAKDVPALADACANAKPADGDGVMSGRCAGRIVATPEQGKPGTPLGLRVQITGAETANITRVIVDNPGCTTSRCRDTQSLGAGLFAIWLAFQAAPGAPSTGGIIARFRVKFQAFSGATLMCSGQSTELRVLAR